jgi:uncharacterized phage-associated protein
MAYSAKQVANEFLELARRDGVQLTPMQVQKLVYFAYGWYLAITGERLLNERVQAWQWGPVIPSLYGEFKPYGSGPITMPSGEVFTEDGKVKIRQYRLNSSNPAQDEFARQLIARVWNIYGKYSAVQLSSMTHAANSPWSKIYDENVRGTDIPDELIKEYFQRIATPNDKLPAASR